MWAIRILGVILSVLVAVAAVWWSRSAPVREEAVVEQVKIRTLVVAAEPLRYGQKIGEAQLKAIEWRSDALPAGSFETLLEVGVNNDGPFALAAVAQGAPILRSQITAPGQKPSLSARLGLGEVAVTIPVNTITGVAGFVLPEERVDVLLTRTAQNRRFADIILQNIRVLAVNSMPDAGKGEPVIAKSVTFAAAREDAQKLVVAAGIGEVSLVLRSSTAESYGASRRISDLEVVPDMSSEPTIPSGEIPAADVAGEAASDPPPPPPPPPPEAEPPAPPPPTEVLVFHGLEGRKVTVP